MSAMTVHARRVDSSHGTPLQGDNRIIAKWIEEGAKVLDLGCGEGDLLAWLVERKGVRGRGLEIDKDKVARCLSRGLTVAQGDIHTDLKDYPSGNFDYVILSQTLQMVRQPLQVLRQMRRIGQRVVVAFPNFGHLSVRMSLLCSGRAPKTEHLPYKWYETPNIRVLTILDFEELLDSESLRMERARFLRRGRPVTRWPNLRADSAIYLLS